MEHSFSKRRNVRLITFLSAGLIVLGVTVLKLAASNMAYEEALSQSYARAFSALAESVEKMDTSLEKSTYVTSPEMISRLCTEIYGEARTAQQAVGELPYGNVELEQTAAFVAKVGDYAEAVGRSASNNGGYSGDELENISELRRLTAELSQELDELEGQLYDGTLTLEHTTAVEERLSGIVEEGNVLAGSSYESVESDFPELPSLIYDGPFSDHLQSRKRAVLEGEKPLTLEEAKKAAGAFLGVSASELTDGYELEGDIPCYCFYLGEEWTIQVTKQGGYVLSILNGREVGTASLSHEEGVERARAYLTEHHIDHMKETYFIDHGNRLTVNFASVEGEVVCYPDLIKVEVALDNGEIIGFESEGYLTNHTKRQLKAELSAKKAKKKVSDRLSIQSTQLALIPTDGKHEVLCWEFRCKNKDGQSYLVYINAQTGKEQQLLILLEDEKGTLTM